MKGLLEKLNALRPSRRRSHENEMREELESLAALAEPGELGNLTRLAEEGRTAWTWSLIEQLVRDLQYAFCNLRQNPAFTATAVLSLALGIGANTAIFSLLDALMLRWLPVHNPQELVQLKLRSPRADALPAESFSFSIVKALAGRQDLFAHVCGFSAPTFGAGSPGAVRRVQGAWVTGGCFATFELQPALGRLLTETDDQVSAPLVTVLSYRYWDREYGGDPGIIGRNIEIEGHPVTVVGIAPRGFDGATVGAPADITLPVAALRQLNPSSAGLLGPGNFWLKVIARPLSGSSLPQTEAHVRAVWGQIADGVISPRWSPSRREEMKQSRFEVTAGGTGYTYLRQVFTRPLQVLMGVAGLVLLIACANVASLLLARTASRRREIAVRLAIGAGRGRIVRQLLTESTLLSVIGAAGGVWLAWFSSRLLVRTFSGMGSTVVFDLTPNWHVAGFAAALALATGIVFGLAPALGATSLKESNAVNEHARATPVNSGVLSWLVGTQVALSLLLLVGAGLFVRTLQNLVHTDTGFRSDGVLLVELDGGREGYRGANLTTFYSGLLDRVGLIPGVSSASLASQTPLSGSTWSEAAVPKGQPIPQVDTALFVAVTPGFFGAMQTPLLAGRDFDAHDTGALRLAIVNQKFAARHFAGRNPIGQYLTTGIPAGAAPPPTDLQIVGVVKDSLSTGLRSEAKPTVYVPYFQRGAGYDDSIVVRASGSLAAISDGLHRALQSSFPHVPLEVRALSDQVAQTLLQERLMAKIAGGFGVLGLILACVGLYGLLAYTVVRRTKEIGIRMALGAQKRAVLRMVATRALRLVGIGILAGLPIAWLLARSIQSMLFGLKATDPGVMATAALLLAGAGLLAAYFPARRAASVDPVRALRED